MNPQWLTNVDRCLTVGFLMTGMLLQGCATTTLGPVPPSWWSDPRPHDAQHLYFKAHGQRHSLEDARRAAMRSIRAQIAEYIFTEVRVQNMAEQTRISVESFVSLSEVESFREDDTRHSGAWNVWILGRYPQSEYQRIRKRLALGVRLEQQWSEAQSAINRQQLATAEPILLSIINEYDKALRPSFDLESVKIELASLYLKQNRAGPARQWIRDVKKSARDSKWARKAEVIERQLPAISYAEAFDEKKIGILAMSRTDGPITADARLTADATMRFNRDGVQTTPRPDTLKIGLNVIDASVIRRVANAFTAAGADAVFMLLFEIDPDKTDATIRIPLSEERTAALDAKLQYWVIRASDAQVMASGSTPGRSEQRTGLLNAILTHRRHMPHHAPAIAEALGTDR